jgi:putative transposon-encoded protein
MENDELKKIKKIRMSFNIDLDEGNEVIEREVKKFGNASHIILPQKHEGKKAFIIVTDEIKDMGTEVKVNKKKKE